LNDPALGAVENMARDEALLRCIGPNQPPILRTYTWHPAALSLGYFQDVAEAREQSPHIRSMPLVRRTTGGGAILHDLELTYSLTLPIDHPLVAGRPNCLYDAVHRAIASAVRDTLAISAQVDLHASVATEPASPGVCGSAQRGPFFCFARRHAYDVVVLRPDGTSAKLAGSAQRRARVAMPQAGTEKVPSLRASASRRAIGHASCEFRRLRDRRGLGLARPAPCRRFERNRGELAL